MRDVIQLLFWLWVLVSVFLLVRRQVDKRSAGNAEPDLAPIPDDIVATLPPTSGMVPDDVGPLLTGGASPPAMPMDVPPVNTATTSPSDSVDSAPDANRHGLFAPGPVEDAPAQTAAVTSVATVADALRGVDWPCGLTPVIDVDAMYVLDKQVTVSTTEATALEVGRRFGDALEAIGYSLQSQTDTVAKATRPDAILEIRIHPKAALAQRAGVKLYPTLPADAVVVVCELK